jgi:hypothetical protein
VYSAQVLFESPLFEMQLRRPQVAPLGINYAKAAVLIYPRVRPSGCPRCAATCPGPLCCGSCSTTALEQA